MNFTSFSFLLCFLPSFAITFSLTPARARNLVLSLFSLVFFAWWRLDFVALLAFAILLDFWIAIKIEAVEAPRPRFFLLMISVVANLSVLGFFKYTVFLVESTNSLLGLAGAGLLTVPKIILPIGISFYTFQTMSYTIDVYRKTVRPLTNLVDFVAYVTSFPQLVAGPIVRLADIRSELLGAVLPVSSRARRGADRFMIGFAKKVIIADSLGQIADFGFAYPGLSTADAWLSRRLHRANLF